MAKYLGTDGKNHNVNLVDEKWEYHDYDYDNILRVECNKSIPELFKFDKDLSNEDIPIGGYLEIGYDYAEDDTLALHPIMTYVGYEKGFNSDEVYMDLTDSEKTYFQDLLTSLIGDKHTSEEQRIMMNYEKAIDKDVSLCVHDVLHDREFLPVTVGYLSDTQCNLISHAFGSNIEFAPRVVIDADAIRHIINRHGANGKADHSMTDENDIARLPYVLANFDKVTFDGVYSHKYKCKDGTAAPHVTLSKKIDGTYYVITAVTDAKANKSHIVSAYIH